MLSSLEKVLGHINNITGFQSIRHLSVDVYKAVVALVSEEQREDLISWNIACLREFEIAAHEVPRQLIKVSEVLKLQTLHLNMFRLPEEDTLDWRDGTLTSAPRTLAGNVVLHGITCLVDVIPNIQLTTRKCLTMINRENPPMRWRGSPNMSLAHSLAAVGDNELFYHL